MEDGGVTFCKHVLPIENLSASFNDLMESLGEIARLPPGNWWKYNRGKACASLLKFLPTDELYNETAQQAMREHFALDFLHLGDSSRSSVKAQAMPA